jgi:hypothetical protein
VFEGCEVTAYSAGHVLGAAILHLRVGGESVVYTGKREWVCFISLADLSNTLLPLALLHGSDPPTLYHVHEVLFCQTH